jgi:rhodanese-related sulfurtransferase
MKNAVLMFSLLLGATVTSFAHNYPNPVSPQDTKAWVEQNEAVMIDVREEAEVAQGMAQPAAWYAKSAIDSSLDGFVKYLGQYPGKEIVLYCRSGHRASLVAEQLATRKIKVWNMGGFKDWVDAGFATKTPSAN